MADQAHPRKGASTISTMISQVRHMMSSLAQDLGG